jgi:hypothetical protein
MNPNPDQVRRTEEALPDVRLHVASGERDAEVLGLAKYCGIRGFDCPLFF